MGGIAHLAVHRHDYLAAPQPNAPDMMSDDIVCALGTADVQTMARRIIKRPLTAEELLEVRQLMEASFRERAALYRLIVAAIQVAGR